MIVLICESDLEEKMKYLLNAKTLKYILPYSINRVLFFFACVQTDSCCYLLEHLNLSKIKIESFTEQFWKRISKFKEFGSNSGEDFDIQNFKQLLINFLKSQSQSSNIKVMQAQGSVFNLNILMSFLIAEIYKFHFQNKETTDCVIYNFIKNQSVSWNNLC